MSVESRQALFRARDTDEEHRATYIELFFDLVFVLAITQLAQLLAANLTPTGALETMVLFVGLWWLWMNTSWATNWLDPDTAPVRLMLMTMMLVGLFLATSIPKAFEVRGEVVAAAFVAMQLGRTLFMLWAVRDVHAGTHANFKRIAVWQSVSGLVWIAGGIADGPWRLALWGAAVAIETAGPACYFWVPVMGASSSTDWDISGSHMSERCALFVIIALGETLLVSGVSFVDLPRDAKTVAALVSTFVAAATMWWIYFDVGAHRGAKQMEESDDPGRIARNAYSYFHLPLVAGIIVLAVGDKKVLADPDNPSTTAFALVTLGGVALFLIGTMFFKRETSRMASVPLSHRVGVGMLLALVPLVPYLQAVTLHWAATATLIVVAVWERISIARNPELAEPDPAA